MENLDETMTTHNFNYRSILLKLVFC